MKINPFTNYLKWLIKQISDLHKIDSSHNSIYKIVGKEKNENTNEDQFIIQVNGKNVFLKLSPSSLMNDEAMLRGFSSLDVRTITYMACQTEKATNKKKSLYRIIAQFFSKNRKEEMFSIQEENNIVQIIKSAQEISSNPELIKKFNAEDAHRIGYITGIEQAIVENDYFLNIKPDKN